MRRLIALLIAVLLAAGCLPPLRRPQAPVPAPAPAPPPALQPGREVPGAPNAQAPEPAHPVAAAYAGRGAPATWPATRTALLLAPPARRESLARAWAGAVRDQGAPLLEGGAAHFFYLGPARSVTVSGDWTNWAPAPLERFTGTDLWVRSEPLPPDAVFSYRLTVDGHSQADPLNPRVSRAVGTDWSVYIGPRAPGQEPPAAVAPGRRRTLTVESAALGRTVTVDVHVPPECTPAAPCPVLYVADGPFYLGEGRVVQTAAAAARAGRLPPLVVAGIAPPPNPILRTVELLPGLRGDAWPRFLRAELAPAVEQAFPVRRDRLGRALVGQSAGAAAMLQAALHDPGAWGRAVIQSPAALPSPLEQAADAFAGPPVLLWLSWGRWERNVFGLDVTADAARMAARLHGRGLAPAGGERPGGHTMALWRRDLATALEWVFAPVPEAR